MEPINELYAVRKDKEKYLKEQGIETYPQDRGPYITTQENRGPFREPRYRGIRKERGQSCRCGTHHGLPR